MRLALHVRSCATEIQVHHEENIFHTAWTNAHLRKDHTHKPCLICHCLTFPHLLYFAAAIGHDITSRQTLSRSHTHTHTLAETQTQPSAQTHTDRTTRKGRDKEQERERDNHTYRHTYIDPEEAVQSQTEFSSASTCSCTNFSRKHTHTGGETNGTEKKHTQTNASLQQVQLVYRTAHPPP